MFGFRFWLTRASNPHFQRIYRHINGMTFNKIVLFMLLLTRGLSGAVVGFVGKVENCVANMTLTKSICWGFIKILNSFHKT